MYRIFNSIFHDMDIVYEFKGEAEAYYDRRIRDARLKKKTPDELRDKGYGYREPGNYKKR